MDFDTRVYVNDPYNEFNSQCIAQRHGCLHFSQKKHFSKFT